ncbi:hypothetical protein A2227_07050 [Candidatus Falkowbacteria bacterium RIFOXYA2_FULL_47_19]|uniref:Uncharacterized protein n=1 Tax=Candidatus Falkowbacteria bacterium RIFOXYA2_FULL_47_19 TaxID=1797994 RepID=A0A1F5SEE8_9BACT|nr:MAG: hypothetical protein A2227_07050 [Candidatus Falkowbacteria bacterium RIFOXYA2_FULL_47_19]
MDKKNFLRIIIGGLGVFFLTAILGGCTQSIKFKPGDIRDDFCGAHLNFQYCKCAFHNDFCDKIGMKRGEAKKYVNEKYEKWVETEFDKFKNGCRADNGYIKGKACFKCGGDEIAGDDTCADRSAEAVKEDEGTEEANDEVVDQGQCKYDSDCEPICEGDVMWKMGCNPRGNICEKTFDTDCASDPEIFGSQQIMKTCQNGTCVRNEEAIAARKQELAAEKKMWSDAVKETNAARDNIRTAMMDANKNCINGIADMTNVAIIEFSTRIASVLAGGIPDIAAMTASAAEKAAGLAAEHVKNLAGAATDYAGDALQRLYNYQTGEPAETEKKLAPHEYIKLNCDLYEYFKGVLAESDADLEAALKNATEADRQFRELP